MKLIYTILLGIILSYPSFAQLNIQEEKKESKTQGFFVNNGSIKLDDLECYNFKDLIVSFDIQEFMWEADYIYVYLKYGRPESNGQTDALATYSYRITNTDFNRLFKDKEYAYFKVFSTDDMSEKSELFGGLRRGALQNTTLKKNVDASILQAKVHVSVTIGKKIDEYGNVYNRYRWDEAANFSIDLKNRKRIPRTYMFNDDKAYAVDTSGDCY